eukprot:3989203-Amphidinium_carterae.1
MAAKLAQIKAEGMSYGARVTQPKHKNMVSCFSLLLVSFGSVEAQLALWVADGPSGVFYGAMEKLMLLTHRCETETQPTLWSMSKAHAAALWWHRLAQLSPKSSTLQRADYSAVPVMLLWMGWLKLVRCYS